MLQSTTRKPVIIWLLTGCFLIFLMVVIGGITRLTHSGLSMTDWHLITGSIPPLNAEQWTQEFNKYKNFPEFNELNYHFTIVEFKSIFMWEYVHRLLGRILGLVFFIPFIYFLIRKQLNSSLIKKCVVILLMGAFQGGLGWYMVKSGLVNNPHVSHYRLAAHLLTAFLTCSYIFWVALDLLFEKQEKKTGEEPIVLPAAIVSLCLLIVQIIYGAFVAGSRAGFVFNTYPKMGSDWFPEAIFAYSNSIIINLIDGVAGIQFVHRYLAILVFASVVVTWWKTIKSNVPYSAVLGGRLLFYLVVLQFTLGVFTLLYSVPLSLGIAHQVTAFCLLLCSVYTVHRLKKG